MSEALFSDADRVTPSTVALPAELQGKTAAEVAAYYQKENARLATDLRTARETPPTPVQRVQTEMPKNEDFWSDPKASVTQAIKAGSVSREEFNNASDWVRRQMTEMAEFLTKQKHSDWDIFAPVINDIMSKIEPAARADSTMWETAYIHARGLNPEKAVQQTVVPITSLGAERGSPGPGAPPPPEAELTTEQEYVRSRMGITKQMYTEAQKHIASGTWPLTVDNRESARR